MPSPKYIKKDYAVIRDDNTYVVYTLNNTDFEKLEISLMNGNPYVKLTLGIIGLKDVRAIVEQKAEVKSKKEIVKENPSGTPDMDVMSFEYLKQQEKVVKEWLDQHPEFDDDEVEGGQFS